VDRKRCGWAGDDTSSLMLAYHDEEWGVPSHDDGHLFELLVLEGAQAGLSWQTILNKREGYRRAFAGFDPSKVARFDARRVARLLSDPTIVRNRLKVESAVTNARGVVAIQKEMGSFAEYLWAFVEGSPIVNRWLALGTVPSETDESRAMSRDLKRRGFGFVGPTVCYAFMQATGLVQDHLVSCFRYAELGADEQLGDPRSPQPPRSAYPGA
jgi:DNA-3-methyladenine glycosylase I